MIIGIDASRANEERKTGVGWYAFHVIQELKKITPENIRVVLYTNKPLMGELTKLPNGWTEKVLHWPPKRLWTQIRLSWEMLVNPPDVLFIPAHVFPLIHPKKTVMTVHDIAAIKFPESYNWFERWYTLWSAKYAVKKLWKVIVPSEFTRKELVSLKVSKFASNNVIVVNHGYDERYKKIENKIKIEEMLKKFKIEQPYLLSVGRLEDKKNTVNIIKAFEQIKNNFSPRPELGTKAIFQSFNLQLLLVGQPGFGYKKVKEVIDNSQFKNDIITPGWVDNEDLLYLMSGAKVFVFPSLYEGFGIPILEAMANGVPVVASRGTCLEEIGGEACFYVDPQNANEITSGILQLIENKDLREDKIKKGLEIIKQFSWEKCACETLDCLSN